MINYDVLGLNYWEFRVKEDLEEYFKSNKSKPIV